MGNCFAACLHGALKHEKIKVLRVEDGDVLEYTHPLKIKDLLLQNPGCDIIIQRDELQNPLPGDHTMEYSRDAQIPLPGDHMMRPGVLYRIVGKKDDGIYEKRSSIGSEEKGVFRVKIVLTKQELAQLLSKCGDGGGRMKDVLGELKKIGTHELNTVPCSPCPGDAWRPVLESIPEDS